MWNEVLVTFLKKSFSIRCLLVVNNISLHKKKFGMRHLAESHTVKHVTLGRTSDNFKDFVKLMLICFNCWCVSMPHQCHLSLYEAFLVSTPMSSAIIYYIDVRSCNTKLATFHQMGQSHCLKLKVCSFVYWMSIEF